MVCKDTIDSVKCRFERYIMPSEETDSVFTYLFATMLDPRCRRLLESNQKRLGKKMLLEHVSNIGSVYNINRQLYAKGNPLLI